ncbi:response regulator transcription factor [Caloranaerobacter azorensis]|uniref:Two-component system, OmpR family, alkaline phosphatase synthesis response regulator PhoP n=3 Tax=Caloranaerobacter azorensis TaxID=116090 RepID=A0A1M5U1J6_9FIRM|nr:response regulator transcription factor [Caloranaerobacter azorensis]KGG79752.1 ArsR family transcriptional regulator [Caloranaerobacter azorensis H53214]QIB26680.1 response regulator transcription factor [Caloranaerobacter azorensis]SHH56834.1 two-component system, OmpR family, alkaline phosphatase synthesis response regulator PhoP [Caloranaerobacter azorensis DSM 13643]
MDNLKKILIVDDEEHIIELIRFNLETNGYQVITANDGNEALKKIREEKPNLVILDLMLPSIDGIEICKILRKDEETEKLPIIMLTAKSEEIDMILGLEIGADDYITKPFSVRELLARIKAVLRRTQEIQEKRESVLKIGDIMIDIEKHEVTKKGKKIDLTLKEFELLRILSEKRGNVLTRNYLLDEIWGYNYFGDTRTVDVHIRHLRRKIEDDDKNPQYIQTIRGIGYKMK